MEGIDPVTYLQKVAVELHSLTERNEIETTLDEVEYLYEAVPPELQYLAEQVIAQLHAKLEQIN